MLSKYCLNTFILTTLRKARYFIFFIIKRFNIFYNYIPPYNILLSILHEKLYDKLKFSLCNIWVKDNIQMSVVILNRTEHRLKKCFIYTRLHMSLELVIKLKRNYIRSGIFKNESELPPVMESLNRKHHVFLHIF